jgi:hypothetical protein
MTIQQDLKSAITRLLYELDRNPDKTPYLNELELIAETALNKVSKA